MRQGSAPAKSIGSDHGSFYTGTSRVVWERKWVPGKSRGQTSRYDHNYHSATPPPVLASCAAAHILQACRHGVPVRPWTWTGLYLADALQPVARIPDI